MKILGIDTTTKFLCLGIYGNAKIYEYNLEVGVKLSSLLTQTINRVLVALGWRIGDIDYFACGLGPGSFTGVRIGLSTIKGLAWSLNKPVVGISTLDILAKNIKAADGHIVPALDAKRGLVYCSTYKTEKGILQRIMPYMLLNQQEFLGKLKNRAIVLGDAMGLYKEKILRTKKTATVLDKDYWYPSGRNIIDLALRKIKDGKLDTCFKAQPIYLYPKECQIKKA